MSQTQDPIGWGISKAAQIHADAAKIQASLPDDPARDSLEFWQVLSRENTGISLCDSGMIYGYEYQKPPRSIPISLEFWGNEVIASISTAHWLETHCDANDPVAVALETELMALAKDPEHERENWFTCVHDWLQTFSDGPRSFTVAGADYEVLPTEERDNVYNHENDFSQVFVYELLQDNWDQSYALIHVHTGCDVRGGYSTPVIAKIVDLDYFYDWTADAYCHNCDQSWEMLYSYSEALAKIELNDDDPESQIAGIELDGKTADAERCMLLCPNCGQNTVGVYNSVYGI